MSDMWAGWEDVANQPQDEAARGQVLKRLETLVGGIHFSQASLGAQWTPVPREPRRAGRTT